MKKDYRNPEISIIRYETPDTILASSVPNSGAVDVGSGVLGKTNGYLANSWLHS